MINRGDSEGREVPETSPTLLEIQVDVKVTASTIDGEYGGDYFTWEQTAVTWNQTPYALARINQTIADMIQAQIQLGFEAARAKGLDPNFISE